ncbi:unnamed protein product [Caenorhabditis bovis]|uniref:Uncharacterized protein n=1 Tax=Caenorhabditis bovis TaxID=2654633 RepID=A0A8S1EIV3_9PELO|nr:unnamed protein product [Caenorhabditis bovis]
MRLLSVLALAFVLLVLFCIGIFLLIPFPLAIFQQIVNSQVYIQRKYDGQYPTGTYFWSRLPATQYFEFYLFNVTNPDEVLYYGAKPNVIDVGPYTYAETEFKDFIEFRNDDKEVFYQNNKTWIFNKSKSCRDCNFDDNIITPNTAYMSVVYIQINQANVPILNLGMDLLTLITGEVPLRTISGSGTLFVGYSDPIINLINSQLAKMVLSFLGNPLEIPQVVTGGFFPEYNHTCDGNYTAKTGKDKVENTALIQTWLGRTHLPWWNSEETRDLRNSGDGSFQKPGLKKSDKLKQFQSFACRTYSLSYSGQSGTSNGIPVMDFKMNDDNYDTFKHPGYRYENNEKVNYFPNWPCGPNHKKKDNGNCAQIDCNQYENFCHSCCDGSFINGTYLLPPGMVPQRCLPGQIIEVPFGAFLSPPHFYSSPAEVTNSIGGLHPQKEKHETGHFKINPTTGSTVDASFRMQLSIPIFNSVIFTTMSNSPNSIIPSFWLNISIEPRDYAISYLKFSIVTIPAIILGVGISFLVISVISTLAWIFLWLRKRKANNSKTLTTRYLTEIPSTWESE